MNRDNMLYVTTDNLKGYRPGSFWDTLTRLILDVPPGNIRRFEELDKLFHIADSRNRAALEACLPGVVEVLIKHEYAVINKAESIELLEDVLEVLPFLLMRFKPLVEVIDTVMAESFDKLKADLQDVH